MVSDETSPAHSQLLKNKKQNASTEQSEPSGLLNIDDLMRVNGTHAQFAHPPEPAPGQATYTAQGAQPATPSNPRNQEPAVPVVPATPPSISEDDQEVRGPIPFQRQVAGKHPAANRLVPLGAGPGPAADSPFLPPPPKPSVVGNCAPPAMGGSDPFDVSAEGRLVLAAAPALRFDSTASFPPRGYGWGDEQPGGIGGTGARPPSAPPVLGPRGIGGQMQKLFGPQQVAAKRRDTDLFPAGDFHHMGTARIPQDALDCGSDPKQGARCSEDLPHRCPNQANSECGDWEHTVSGGHSYTCWGCQGASRRLVSMTWDASDVMNMRAYPCSGCLDTFYTNNQFRGTGISVFGTDDQATAVTYTEDGERKTIGGGQGKARKIVLEVPKSLTDNVVQGP